VEARQNPLDQVFKALAVGSRRAMVERLVQGPATVGELARPLAMSLPAVMQHLQVLEDCGLVRSEKIGRIRTCRIEPTALRQAEDWLRQQRTDWEIRLDSLGTYLDTYSARITREEPMTEHSVLHSSFSLERTYPVPVSRVFAAWADPASKAAWFSGEGNEHRLDFSVGGLEVIRSERPDGRVLTVESRYHDIVPERRIVYSSTLSADGVLATVSLTTVELRQEGDKTRLLLVEQDTFLDGHEQPSWREQGTGGWLDALGAELTKAGGQAGAR
jgi:uncharacterized protein YndB with AHSA1/START domain/DNA-binding transcriptional ArsR family regulator